MVPVLAFAIPLPFPLVTELNATVLLLMLIVPVLLLSIPPPRPPVCKAWLPSTILLTMLILAEILALEMPPPEFARFDVISHSTTVTVAVLAF